MKNQNWTYRDLDFNFIEHPVTGDVSTKVDNSDVIQSVKNLVLTQYYERGFNVELGSTANKSQMFENFTPLLAQEIKQDIKNVINNFEPRADLDSIDIGFEGNFLAISIKFNILNNERVEEVFIRLMRTG